MKEFIPQTVAEKYFGAVSAIPRPSTMERAVSDYVAQTARDLGLQYHQDALGNVIVWKPASSGRETEAPVMLQAHMDMVTVCAPGAVHDFERDPLALYEDDAGRLRARDTTLGADDGYGCAYLLAAMTERFSHPPLECVFTVQEENGCYGAQGLDTSLLSSRRMIGLDTMGQDIEYTCCVSCYCSDRLTVTREVAPVPTSSGRLSLRLSGVQPVRTGALVHPEQGNAIKIMARLLASLPLPYQLIRLQGGEAENYNPVACEAEIAVSEAEIDSVKAGLEETLRTVDGEVNEGSQRLRLEIGELGAVDVACSREDTQQIIALLDLMPSATFEISPRDGSMIATNNVGIVQLDGRAFRLIMSDRARDAGCLDGITRRARTLCALCGCALTVETRYMPWVYRPDSPLLRATASLMKERFGHDMVENICPGGLELCDFLPRMPDLDCVMFAPIGGACHSTAEWMDRASFNRMYGFLKELLGRI